MAKKQKTNFTFEIDHPETAAPQAIQASVVGQKGLLTFKAVEINELTPCKTNFVFEIQHPKHITAEEIASKMEGGQNCLTFKVLNYEAVQSALFFLFTSQIIPMEHDYSQEIANSPTTKNFFSAIEEVLKEYQAESLTRKEAIKRFFKEKKKKKKEVK